MLFSTALFCWKCQLSVQIVLSDCSKLEEGSCDGENFVETIDVINSRRNKTRAERVWKKIVYIFTSNKGNTMGPKILVLLQLCNPILHKPTFWKWYDNPLLIRSILLLYRNNQSDEANLKFQAVTANFWNW